MAEITSELNNISVRLNRQTKHTGCTFVAYSVILQFRYMDMYFIDLSKKLCYHNHHREK